MEIATIGGFDEVGKNMTALKVKDEAVILDMGFFIPNLVTFEEDLGERANFNTANLLKKDVIPDDSFIASWTKNVKAIACSHAHLDHIGAVPYLAGKYNAPVLGTPYTMEVLDRTIRDGKVSLKNKRIPISPNGMYKVSKNIKIEFLNMTHSVIQTAMIAVHTPDGILIYANDFKFDNHPVLGTKPNYKRLKELGNENVIGLVVDSLYSSADKKTPSEKVAREMLKDVMLGTENEDNAIIVSAFSSHLARLKSVVDFGHKLDRKVVFLGRSMSKYISAAENIGFVNFSKENEIVGYRGKIDRKLKDIEKNRTKYVIVCTGGQGEPNAVLTRMTKNKTPFRFLPEDHVIFSNKVIPAEENIKNRAELEDHLKSRRVRLFKDIHTSVLPDTEVVVNDHKSMKIKKIKDVKYEAGLRVPGFDRTNLKMKWFDARLIKHDYEGKIFKIKTKTGRNVGITSGHSVFVLRNGELLGIPGDDVIIGDYLAIPKTTTWDKEVEEIDMLDFIEKKDRNFYLFSYDNEWIYYAKRKISPRKIKLDYNFGRLLGYYLAEGCAPRHINLTFGSHEEDLVEECKKNAKIIFPCNVHDIKNGSKWEVQFGANLLGRIFKEWFGRNAREKKIPNFVFSGNEEFKLAFLGAYINGDGHIEEKSSNYKIKHLRIRTKTASEKLTSDLMYLYSQVGILAKFDHKEVIPARIIGGNQQRSPESTAYVLRVQDRRSIEKISSYLKEKSVLKIKNHFENKKLKNQETVPLALPIEHINWNEVETGTNTYLRDLKNNKRKKHIGIEIIKRDSNEIKGLTKAIIEGDLLFDPISEINEEEYCGEVYDFKVPGAENFVGGFGGIMLHNSGHCGREDLRDLVKMVNPQHIIPAHGPNDMVAPMIELAEEMGYKAGRDAHLMKNWKKIEI